ncbi:MAG: hypothetical protein HOY79_33780 [Streptomyces sp.]|nr:hypothetical protein [Streptomyces sp.]NUS11337.1 hypothetical protein [Streptomyces sp.]NUS23388.1 hypothetical protein [Streptomyces sp.]
MKLRDLTDDELCELYGTADEATQTAIRIECDRRDMLDRKAAYVKARRDAAIAQWQEHTEAQIAAAERACNGYLLSKAGRAAGINPYDLWTGPLSRAARYASEELREFWERQPRITRTQFVDLLAAARRAERAA